VSICVIEKKKEVIEMAYKIEDWEEKRRKSKNPKELRFLNEMKALELKARTVEMENQLNTIVSRVESKMEDLETRMSLIEQRKRYKTKNESELEEIALNMKKRLDKHCEDCGLCRGD
jgi:hypothetical protein